MILTWTKIASTISLKLNRILLFHDILTEHYAFKHKIKSTCIYLFIIFFFFLQIVILVESSIVLLFNY